MTDRYPAERRDRLHPRFRPARASALLLLIAPLVGPVPSAGAVDPPVPVRLPQAPPLPPPRGPVIEVADAQGIDAAPARPRAGGPPRRRGGRGAPAPRRPGPAGA